MNFSFYTFGTPKGRYSQYPDDYTTSLITGFQRELTGIQLVIHREMNLMYYVFSERLDKTQTIGFCLVLNNARIKKPCALISLFRFIVEIYLVNNKSIYQMDDDGRWKFKVDNLSGCFGEHQILKDFIDIEFDRFNFKYGIEPLSTIYNGTKTIGNLGLDVTTDHQILETTSRHNTVIIKGDRGIAQGNLSQTIALWQKRYEEVTNRNAQLSGELANLKRAKKQTRWVAILAIAVIASLIGIYFLNDNLSGKNNTIEQLQTSLDERELALESTQDSLDSVTQQLEVTANKLDLVGNEHPIVIENIEIGNIDDDGYLRRDLNAIADDLIFQAGMDISEKDIEPVLQIIQDFEPAGVGARNLKECLLIQLKKREPNEKTHYAERILEEYFDEFTRKPTQSQAMNGAALWNRP